MEAKRSTFLDDIGKDIASTASSTWNGTGGKAVHFVDRHEATIIEISLGVVVVAGVVVATVATGGIADAVVIGAVGASDEVAVL